MNILFDMLKLKLNSKNEAVTLLQELLNEYGYQLVVSENFNAATDAAVRDFQTQNGLVSDGVVFTKTWTKLINNVPVDLTAMEEKFLKDEDIVSLANELGVEVAVVRAVNEVESSGRGFLIDGRTKILFEGHIFWNELKKRGIDPNTIVTGNEDVLYPKWTKKFYKGGKAEYDRLNKAIGILNNSAGTEAAYASASWGLFQIMGFHYKSLGYAEIVEFVGD
ncbi:MAG: N-acetylmuramidase domain-containing protein, partial [Chitinophagales bacterium]